MVALAAEFAVLFAPQFFTIHLILFYFVGVACFWHRDPHAVKSSFTFVV